MNTQQDVFNFWFKEISASARFKKDENFDNEILRRFLEVYRDVVAGKTAGWRITAEGRLSEIIVLDQFSRNMFRDKPEAFAADDLALQLAQTAVNSKIDQELPLEQRVFLYMPYMHSEDAHVHEQALKLFSQKGLEDALKYEILHKNIIDRFGRYPHRNKILGRISTAEEIEFMKGPNSSF